ncbi:hypothetical protein NEOLI_001898 [Neolecta irregularis DAH-3]|uniref:Uncharacterized protein n=1 Tax=Neolecta irregularis (strain DAH-3) TaxID=1198029 RepID=A0A1U7LW70_NEOID|nr:hypothetical protein NEOLI_001898 [Neolecta irregularis DAH-3]|eukprot:OLL26869.1 hypothetical protein NEOLI_001898 [Neolecta irregularis DAH-3]
MQIFDTLSATDWIRLITVVGSYLLVRPYIVKLGSRIQQKEFKKAEANDDIDVVEDSWGAKARLRQLKCAMGGDEKDDDSDIEGLLEH